MNGNNPFLPISEGEDALYNGRSFPSLGIHTGDRLSLVSEKLAQHVSTLSKDEVIDVSSLIGVMTPCSNKITSNNFTYQVNIQGNTISFSYNMSETIEGVLQDMTVIKSGVEIVTSDMTIDNLKGGVGGATFKASSFPLNAVFQIDVGGSCGIVRMKKEIRIPLLKDKSDQRFEIQDFGDTTLNTPQNVKETLSVITEAIRSLSNKIDTRTLLEGGKPISETVTDVKKEYAYIRDEMLSPDPIENETRELKDRLDKLEREIDSLEQENRRLSRDIDRLSRTNVS